MTLKPYTSPAEGLGNVLRALRADQMALKERLDRTGALLDRILEQQRRILEQQRQATKLAENTNAPAKQDSD